MGIVGNNARADGNCQHLVSLALLKGAVSFDDSLDGACMMDPAILRLRRKVNRDAEPALMAPTIPRSRRALGPCRPRGALQWSSCWQLPVRGNRKLTSKATTIIRVT